MLQSEIASFRLQNQLITHPSFTQPKDVAAWLGAMQAQDYTHAKWAIGLRIPASTDADIEAALDRGDIVRTHVLRPTWHFAAAEDIRWMLALSAPQVKSATVAMNKQLGLDEVLFKRTNALIAKALEGGKQLTREEIMAELAKSGIVANNSQATHIMFEAELDAIVCNGSRRGKQQTYALLDERIPPGKMLARPDAIAELARRYFTSHAPASLADFQWWSGLRAADARAGLEAMQPFLTKEIVENQTLWLPNDFKPKPALSLSVHLLPAFDEFLVSYTDRRASLHSSRKAQTITVNGIFKPVVAVNGWVKGIWKRTFKKDSVLIEKEMYEELSAAEHEAFEMEAKRFETFALAQKNT
ncbi:MAG: AlkZ family DNA glycosylase [Saprospiraceae bacterium]|nr:AlkZ family DNA glycosylase [Saprospiraceae bacterium]